MPVFFPMCRVCVFCNKNTIKAKRDTGVILLVQTEYFLNLQTAKTEMYQILIKFKILTGQASGSSDVQTEFFSGLSDLDEKFRSD